MSQTRPSPCLRLSRLGHYGVVLLLISVCARFGWTYLTPHGANFVDLHVYVGGGQALHSPEGLYGYTYADQTPDFPLPFTYPPFAAILFYPLGLVSFGLVAFCWQVMMMAALIAIVRLSQKLADPHREHRWPVTCAWSAFAIWVEPIRSSFDYGQINIFLTLGVLYAIYHQRWWISGFLIGIATGIKLTPGIAVFYLVGVRRWKTAIWSAAIFIATIGISLIVIKDQTYYYFTHLLGDAHRVGPVASTFNQSWRGGISRIMGRDAGYSLPVVCAIGLTGCLGWYAWRALYGNSAGGDRLGLLLIVELFGLTLSPISWTHHWVWLIPLVIWFFEGPYSSQRHARAVGWLWVVLIVIGIPWLLSFAQPTIWRYERPWYLSWAGLVYLIAVVVTLGWMTSVSAKSANR